jgi:glyoxylase-like metal-dependent hydrolase (beta-lactamase superfamily II)
MELAPNLHRIGSDLVNAYLVADDAGVTIIDAGISGMWADLEPELARMGRSLADVRGVLLTHGDVDHVGFAERLRREHGVPVYVHAADAPRARGEEKKPAVPLGRWRVGALLRFGWFALRRGALRTTPITEVMSLHGGETLELPGSPRVIHVPGHSPGSLAYHVPAVDALFVGDALTTGHVLTGERGPQPAPFTQDPDRALASLTALEATGAAWVLPGHGPPWHRGIAEAARRVRAASGTPSAQALPMSDQPNDANRVDQPTDASRVDQPTGTPPDKDLAYDPAMTDPDEANLPEDSAADPTDEDGDESRP